MDVVHSIWEEKNNVVQRVKMFERCEKEGTNNRFKDERSLYSCCDGNLNFSTATCSEDDAEYGSYKKAKVARQDPLSHRIIEKRRRDRMNNCLADLSRLIPKEYLKKGRGRIEKTEIIEMAIKHLQYLQEQHLAQTEHFRLGYQECMSETMRFMVEVEGHFPRDSMCVRLLNHLQQHCENLSRVTNTNEPAHTNFANIRFQKSPETSDLNNYPSLNAESEVNNNASSDVSANNNNSESEIYDKHSDINGVSYKYKSDIKYRFTQDLHATDASQSAKKRRMSLTSLENQSSNQSSPPSEILYRGNSPESDNTTHCVPPTEMSLELEPKYRTEPSPIRNHPVKMIKKSVEIKSNFKIPVFVLHAKGSFYVPLTIDYKTLVPFLDNYDLLEVHPNFHNIVLHPVTINVNFQSSVLKGTNSYKLESILN